jgi:hypothetical protein
MDCGQVFAKLRKPSSGRGGIMTVAKYKVVMSTMWIAVLIFNQGCKEQDTTPTAEPRELRRRVQMGSIQAPVIELPKEVGRTKFDFAYVANAQMPDILNKTKSFSTANTDPNEVWNPDGLDASEKERFNQCGDDPVSMEVASFYSKTNVAIYGSKTSISKSAACLITAPHAEISGSIYDFSLTNGGGIQLGLSGIPFLSGLSFDIAKYTMDVELRAKAILEKGNHYFSTTTTKSFGKNWKAAAQLNFGMLSLGPSYYSQTPLSTMVKESMTDAINELKKNWTTDEPWYAMVLRSCDKYIYINGGFGNDAGLKVGDIMKIVNMKYFWDGEPCDGYLSGVIPDKTVAYVKITKVGRNISEAEIIENDPNYPHLPDIIQAGARVYAEKLVPNTVAASKKK